MLPPSLRRASFVIRSFENVGPWPLCQRKAFSNIKRQIGNGRSGQRLDDLELNRTPRFERHATDQDAHRKTDELAALRAADIAVTTIRRAMHRRPVTVGLTVAEDGERCARLKTVVAHPTCQVRWQNLANVEKRVEAGGVLETIPRVHPRPGVENVSRQVGQVGEDGRCTEFDRITLGTDRGARPNRLV